MLARASGARADRVGLRQALDYLRDGDVLIVWKDRLGRSLPHLIETVSGPQRRGVGFRSITEASSGRLIFHLFGALARAFFHVAQHGSHPMDDTTRKAIERRAYALWEEAGQPDGSGPHFWLQAEQELRIIPRVEQIGSMEPQVRGGSCILGAAPRGS